MSTQPIAIVGMAGRFPGARDVGELWQNILQRVESIRSFTQEELTEARQLEYSRMPGYVNAGTVVEGAEDFDADFFGFTGREADLLDPQQRVFLECAYEALEHAGCDSTSFPGRIGVFAGSSISSYLLMYLMRNPKMLETVGIFQTMIANDKDYLATRVSYKLNLRGPSMTVQCACSTSLVAVHLACESLRRREADACLAGGISIGFPQFAGYLYKPGMISSPDGRCRAFDADAQGTVFGKGCAVVFLKRLEDALAEGDQIFSVIHGNAVNNDGSAKVGFTAPATSGQADVIRRAQEMAGFDPRTIGFVEAHGTATKLGDPIETDALTEVFRERTADAQFCALGSIKPNIGHLDSAAGVTGLIKSALVLKNGLIPPTLHFKTPNPLMKLESSPFFVNTEVMAWNPPNPRRAGVNAFGVGGTNVHICLEEPPQTPHTQGNNFYQLFPISAKTSSALDQVRERLENHLKTSNDAAEDVAYTLQTGRRAFSHRQFAVARDLAEAADAFRVADQKRTGQEKAGTIAPEVAFLFPGQGSQQPEMAKHIYDEDVYFKNDVDDCCERLRVPLGYDLREILFPDSARIDWASAMLQETVNAQAALFVTEYALARMYMRAGIVPSAMIGHSIGEYVAACIAGVFTVEDALRVVAVRGKLMQSTRPGAMTTVLLSEDECKRYLFNGMAVSVVNAPKMCVVSGEPESITKFEADLKRDRIQTIRLRTSHAFHSPAVEPVLAEFGAFLKTIPLHKPQIPFISNVTATWITDSQATDPNYWVRHMRAPVRFSSSLELLLERPKQVLIEVGTGQSLSALLRYQTNWSGEAAIHGTLPARAGVLAGPPPHLLTIGKLWCSGTPVKWHVLHGTRSPKKVSLPSYPFERRRHFVEVENDAAVTWAPLGKQRDMADWFYSPSWRRSVTKPKPAVSEGDWICFTDEPESTQTLRTELERFGRHVIWVQPGREDAPVVELGADAYSLDITSPAAYEELFRIIQHRKLAGMIFCALRRVVPGTAISKRVRDANELFDSFIFLAQAYKAARKGESAQLEVLTAGLREVLGERISGPERAAIFGVCHTFSDELPNVEVRTIDVEDLSSAAPLVAAEILSGPATESIAYRAGNRWVQSWEKVKLNPLTGSAGENFKQNGVYLLTGGLGGLGLQLSKLLATKFQAKLVLLQRSLLPPREEWDEILTSGRGVVSEREKIQAVRELEKAGASVFVAAGDVASAADVERVWQQAKDRFGRIDGVFHAAGIQFVLSLGALDPTKYRSVLSPKVDGTLILNEWIKRDKVDTFVLFSSISALLSSAGYAVYAGANSVLDAFSFSEDVGANTRVLTINWDAWLEVGMAASPILPDTEVAQLITPEMLEEYKQIAFGHGILPAEGVEAFERVLDSNLQQVVVSTRDLNGLFRSEFERRLNATQKLTGSGMKIHARTVGSDYVPPTSDEEVGVVQIWEELIGVRPIGITEDFFQLGGHSLLGAEILVRIRERFDVQLPLRVLFDAATPGEMAAYIQTIRSAPSPNAIPESTEWEELEI